MSSPYRSSLSLLTGISLALCGLASHAAVVSYVGTQGPKANLFDAAPPTLEASITGAQSSFVQKMTKTGGNEFEDNTNLGFSYTGGNATVTGGAQHIAGATADLTLGRYNLTTGLAPDPSTGAANFGNWFESRADFAVTFNGAVTAFSFFVTDLGDFDGQVFLDVYVAGITSPLSYQLQNTATGEQRETSSSTSTTTANGNLLYFGLTSSVASEYFTSANFRVVQGSGPVDVIGFDSFTVGQYNGSTTPTLPEPGSLALAGLALVAAGATRRARRAA